MLNTLAGERIYVRRRRLLTATAGLAASLSGCAGFALDAPDAADSSSGDREPTAEPRPVPESEWERVSPRPEWERAADARIDEHRRSDVTVEVVRDGEPVADAEVRLRLLEHAFDFSTAYNVARHADTDPDDPYRTWVGRLFNEAVFENAHKWRQWSEDGGHARTHGAIEFLREQGVVVSGAPVVWQHDEHDVLPASVYGALDAGNLDRLRALLDEHITQLVGHNAAAHGVDDWVLLNEQLEEHTVSDALADGPPTRSPPLREWFEIAREAAPNTTLSVNDYDILSLDRPAHRDDYAELVSYLLGGAAPPDEVGFQSHFTAPGERISPTEQYARMDRFASLGDVSLAVSEFDTVDFDSDEQAGEYLYRFLKTAYSHPATAGFRLWGYWDSQHWANEAPLFREDWSKKPGFHAYTDLVFDQWYTDTTATTDADGRAGATATLGTYRLTASVDGERTTMRADVTDPTGQTVRVELAG